MSKIAFLRTALKNYTVGAWTPSSRYVVRRILREIQPEHRYIIEYGAGDGVITRELLRHLPHDARVVAIEINPEFFARLKCIDDPRLLVVGGDVRNVIADVSLLGLPRVDAVVSGIPFSFFTSPVRDSIIAGTRMLLKEGGSFIVYQYSPILLPYLRRHFGFTRCNFEPRNFFPYFIMVATKR